MGSHSTPLAALITVETLVPFEDGVTLEEVTFRQPGLATRFWRLAATPEAAFFFLVLGLTIASFEFFAIGPGVAAGVAAISLLLAGWGIVTPPGQVVGPGARLARVGTCSPPPIRRAESSS